MTYRNCIRLLALLLFLSGCSESESPPTTDKGEQRPADVEAQIDPVGDEPITNSIGMKLKLLPAGTFVMGSHADDAFPAEKPVHKVALTKPFHIGVHEVTQQQYEKVTGENPSNFQSPQNPVNEVSWNDAVQFCQKLSELPEEKAAGLVYRLPTEAEWEYACRAGTSMQYSFGDHESRGLRDYAWFNENSGGEVHPVGQKKPNRWGLYDMHGNVVEWCHDRFGEYSSEAATDPTGPPEGSVRVFRGGSFLDSARACRSSLRGRGDLAGRDPGLGFRVVAVPSSQ